jgi:hypothetical protein
MGTYLISTPDKTENIVHPLELSEKIKASWADVNLLLEVGNNRSFSWFMKIQNRRLDGCLFSNGHLSLDGDIEDCSKFAIWYRKQLPQGLRLVMYDESYNADLDLTNETSEKEIVDVFCS